MFFSLVLQYANNTMRCLVLLCNTKDVYDFRRKKVKNTIVSDSDEEKNVNSAKPKVCQRVSHLSLLSVTLSTHPMLIKISAEN